jgi:tetratricopeptide (TPR) repeat protein
MQRALSYVSVILFVLFLFLPAYAEEEGGGAYYDLGVFAYEDGDYEVAEKHLMKALEFDPGNPFYSHFLGKIYLRTGRYQEAMNYLDAAWKSNPDMSELKYDMAFLNFKMSNYSKAAGLFTEIVDEDPFNLLPHYYELYQIALDHFLAVAEEAPANKANSYYYAGVCYWKTGNNEKAVEKFEYVKDQTESGPLRDNALELLRMIKKEKAGVADEPSCGLYLRVGHYYDDNVPLEPLYDDFYTDEDDYVTNVVLSGKYNFVNKKTHIIGAGYTHYQTWYNELSEYNLTGSLGKLYAKYFSEPFTFGLSYIPSYYWLDSEGYLRRHKLKPEIVWECTDKLLTKLSYSYYDDENFLNDNRDGDTHEVFLDAYYSILAKKAYLFAGVGYEDKSASHPDQEYSRLQTKLGLSLTLQWDVELKLTGEYQEKRFDHVDTFYGVERDDTKYNGSVSLSRKLFCDWLTALAEFNYTKSESNISELEYERQVAGLSLTARY